MNTEFKIQYLPTHRFQPISIISIYCIIIFFFANFFTIKTNPLFIQEKIILRWIFSTKKILINNKILIIFSDKYVIYRNRRI